MSQTTGQVPTLWNRNFLLWWVGAATSAFGASLASIASSFLVLHQTGSAGAMGINLALTLAPGLLTPFLGAWVDRLPLRIPVLTGNILRSVIQLALGWLVIRGTIPLWMIYLSSTLLGLINAFYLPATMGMTARLVPSKDVPRATGLMQGTLQGMQMAGFFGGGLLVAALGHGPALMGAGGLYALFTLLALLIQFPRRESGAAAEPFWTSFQAGLEYVRTRPVLLALPLIVLVMNASLAPVEILLPKRLLDLGAGERGYGVYFGLELGGMMATSLLLASLGGRVKAAPIMVLGMVGMAAGFLFLAHIRTPQQMYLLAVPAGIVSALVNVGIGVLFQQQVNPAFYGRVGSLLNMVGIVGLPVTLFLLAPVADSLSFLSVLTVTGTICLISGAVWAGVLQRGGLLTSRGAIPPEPSAD